MLKNKVW